MKPKKLHVKKQAVVFDETSRNNRPCFLCACREYLTGFQKRKKERRQKAKLENMKLQKEARKKMRTEKKDAVKKKLDAYGLANSKDDFGLSGSVGLNAPEKSCAYEDHPNHVVIINTQPQFGQSLSTLANIDS
ncbi:uncharacterized protein LOC135351274 isoform X2 [Halichondria panicea]|uniref:uncharacterized protein LOC135351274 isoform X2 n=1 Tax=Halichondria panicea TaxID=6063 RepID=UPI00312BA41D